MNDTNMNDTNMNDTNTNHTEHHIQVVRLGTIEKHPNADALSITHIHGGYPCIFRTGDYHEGDLAVYVPVDAVVAANDPRFEFLGDNLRVRAKRLRGIFSMGLLVKPEKGWNEGQDVAEEMHITKYEEEFDKHGLSEKDPGLMPVYGVEGFRRYPDKLIMLL